MIKMKQWFVVHLSKSGRGTLRCSTIAYYKDPLLTIRLCTLSMSGRNVENVVQCKKDRFCNTMATVNFN